MTFVYLPSSNTYEDESKAYFISDGISELLKRPIFPFEITLNGACFYIQDNNCWKFPIEQIVRDSIIYEYIKEVKSKHDELIAAIIVRNSMPIVASWLDDLNLENKYFWGKSDKSKIGLIDSTFIKVTSICKWCLEKFGYDKVPYNSLCMEGINSKKCANRYKDNFKSRKTGEITIIKQSIEYLFNKGGFFNKEDLEHIKNLIAKISRYFYERILSTNSIALLSQNDFNPLHEMFTHFYTLDRHPCFKLNVHFPSSLQNPMYKEILDCKNKEEYSNLMSTKTYSEKLDVGKSYIYLCFLKQGLSPREDIMGNVLQSLKLKPIQIDSNGILYNLSFDLFSEPTVLSKI